MTIFCIYILYIDHHKKILKIKLWIQPTSSFVFCTDNRVLQKRNGILDSNTNFQSMQNGLWIHQALKKKAANTKENDETRPYTILRIQGRNANNSCLFVTTSSTSVLLTTTTSLYLKVEGPKHQFTDLDICRWRKATTYLAYSHPPVGTEYHSITQRHLFCFMSSDAFFSVSPVAKFKQQTFCSETATQLKRT